MGWEERQGGGEVGKRKGGRKGERRKNSRKGGGVGKVEKRSYSTSSPDILQSSQGNLATFLIIMLICRKLAKHTEIQRSK